MKLEELLKSDHKKIRRLKWEKDGKYWRKKKDLSTWYWRDTNLEISVQIMVGYIIDDYDDWEPVIETPELKVGQKWKAACAGRMAYVVREPIDGQFEVVFSDTLGGSWVAPNLYSVPHEDWELIDDPS